MVERPHVDPPCRLLALPVELFVLIARCLDPKTVDVINLRATCQTIRRLINRDQYYYFTLHSGRYRWAYGENPFALGRSFDPNHDHLNDISGHIFADQCKYCKASPSRAEWQYLDDPFEMLCRKCFMKECLEISTVCSLNCVPIDQSIRKVPDICSGVRTNKKTLIWHQDIKRASVRLHMRPWREIRKQYSLGGKKTRHYISPPPRHDIHCGKTGLRERFEVTIVLEAMRSFNEDIKYAPYRPFCHDADLSSVLRQIMLGCCPYMQYIGKYVHLDLVNSWSEMQEKPEWPVKKALDEIAWIKNEAQDPLDIIFKPKQVHLFLSTKSAPLFSHFIVNNALDRHWSKDILQQVIDGREEIYCDCGKLIPSSTISRIEWKINPLDDCDQHEQYWYNSTFNADIADHIAQNEIYGASESSHRTRMRRPRR